jgi:hypothetical protein
MIFKVNDQKQKVNFLMILNTTSISSLQVLHEKANEHFTKPTPGSSVDK